MVINIRHPFYYANSPEWEKWRYTYDGGRNFVEKYLKKYSLREDDIDFQTRKCITYCPAFAKSTLNEIKNSIFQRMADINRLNGSEFYRKAITSNVDIKGHSMNAFIGQQILPELLSMGRVGVFVDALGDKPLTKADKVEPYLYLYRVEDILSWATDANGKLNSLLLRDCIIKNSEYGLASDLIQLFRLCQTTPDGVKISFFNVDGKQVDKLGNETKQNYFLDFQEIPFVSFELSDSLLKDTADYQVALLNIASSDINYILKANFPFYIEQFDPRQTNNESEISVGVTNGRLYPINTTAPSFIAPPTEPLKVSMEKQEQMKEEIRLLMHLSLSNVKSKMASAESKQADNVGLEAGLANIGLELEGGENRIAYFWSLYEGSKPAQIKYPKKYSLKTQEERIAEAKDNQSLMGSVPSILYQKEVAKQIVETTSGYKLSDSQLEAINSEIDEAKTMTSNSSEIAVDVELGLVDLETASKARGYPPGSVEKAKQEHVDRLARIAIAQGDPANRGLKDQSANPNAPRQEKKQSEKEN